MPISFHDRQAKAVTVLGDHKTLRTGPEYPSLVGKAVAASGALNHHLFVVNKGPVSADHPLRQLSERAYSAVIDHLEQHNPSSRTEAQIMQSTDPLHLKAMEDTASYTSPKSQGR
jgi:hypothetical protein